MAAATSTATRPPLRCRAGLSDLGGAPVVILCRTAAGRDCDAAQPTRRRGPRPAVADDMLLAAIRADLARSPWQGEGHRKVSAACA